MKQLRNKNVINIMFIVESMLELLTAIVLAIVGGVFYSKNGGYPNAHNLFSSLKDPEYYSISSDAFDYMAESFLFMFSIMAFLVKVVIAQIGLLKESVGRAVISFICDAASVTCVVMYALKYSKGIDINENIIIFPIIGSIIVIFFALKGTGSAKITLFHGIQMLVEFVIIPLILTLTKYSFKTILGWGAVAIIGVAVAYGFLTGGSGAGAKVSGKSSGASNKKIMEFQKKIDMEKGKMSERADNLKHGRIGADKSGVRSANRTSQENIDYYRKQIEKLEK